MADRLGTVMRAAGNDEDTNQRAALRTAAVVPWLVTVAQSLAKGQEPLAPRPELGYVGSYLATLTGGAPSAEHVTVLSRYLVLTIDHGFNNSTFTARTVASTGTDLTSCLVTSAQDGTLKCRVVTRSAASRVPSCLGQGR
nr:citrate/2-methylcitrate synthase [Flexivirga meconopsidis]